MTVDFHVHSTASDGTWRPSALVAEAVRRGFAAMALTDHDTVAGMTEFMSAPAPDSLRRLAGVELAVEPDPPLDQFHLLGLGVDYENPLFLDFLADLRRGREERNEKMLANFARLGIVIPRDELYALSGGEVLARPHFARWLVGRGLSPDLSAAFRTYLLPDSPEATRCYAERRRPSFDAAAAAVHAAGGLAVLAHPKFLKRVWRTEGVDWSLVRQTLVSLKARGLDGLEARYSANTPEEDAAFEKLADELDLLKTAGSDFHGDAKPSVPLGMPFTPQEALQPIFGNC